MRQQVWRPRLFGHGAGGHQHQATGLGLNQQPFTGDQHAACWLAAWQAHPSDELTAVTGQSVQVTILVCNPNGPVKADRLGCAS